MEEIFSLELVTEPDRRRFARFALEAVEALQGNLFQASTRVTVAMSELRDACAGADGGVPALLVIEEPCLWAVCKDRRWELARLPTPPGPDRIQRLREALRDASESTDPELLRRRNRKIAGELESARQHAAEEMAQLERMLENKKRELQASVRAAETDSLTGLLNRGAFDARLHAAVRHCRRQRQPLSLVLFDLDHFKQINDTNGHPFGDRYLCRMAESMRAAARDEVDHLCRIGGDEFAAIIFADIEPARRVAGEVHRLMEARISAGLALLAAGESPDDLVRRADTALYQAKRSGRGRLAVSGGDSDASSKADCA